MIEKIIITGLSVALIGLLGWSLEMLYSGITDQISGHIEKLERFEKVICANHPGNCPDL